MLDAIIPIKNHSERVPNKNFRLLGEKPLYRHIIDTLLESKYVNHIIIDTDARDKIKIGKKEPITIIDRPEELQGDFVSVNKLIEHDIKFATSDNIIQLHVTNPFLKTKTIDEAILHFEESCKSVFGVSVLQQRAYSIKGKPLNHNPDELKRTQDLDPILIDNSCFYIFSKDFFNRKKQRMNRNSIQFIVSDWEALDIDTEFDWRIAKCLIKK